MIAHRSTTPSLQSERRDKFDRIVIETTGLANPAPIIQTFFIEESVATNMRLDGVVTLVSLVWRRAWGVPWVAREDVLQRHGILAHPKPLFILSFLTLGFYPNTTPTNTRSTPSTWSFTWTSKSPRAW